MPYCRAPKARWPPVLPGTTVVVVSTITTACVAAIGAEATALGVPIIDCGVSGGPSAAASGNLVCMCGGDPEVIAGLAPLFEAIGSLTVTMGPFGTGLAAKLARNLVQYGGWLAAYEGQVLAEAAGIELAKLAQVVRASDAQSGGPATLMFRQTVAPFTPADDQGLVRAMQAAADLARKDLQAALALADELEPRAAAGGHGRSALWRDLRRRRSANRVMAERASPTVRRMAMANAAACAGAHLAEERPASRVLLRQRVTRPPSAWTTVPVT